jgi:hypothetical protein
MCEMCCIVDGWANHQIVMITIPVRYDRLVCCAEARASFRSDVMFV